MKIASEHKLKIAELRTDYEQKIASIEENNKIELLREKNNYVEQKNKLKQLHNQQLQSKLNDMQLQHAEEINGDHRGCAKTTELKMEFHHDLASQLKQEIDILNEKLEAQKKQLQSCTEEISRSENKLKDSRSEIRTLKDAKEDISKKNVKLTEACNLLTNEINDLNTSISKMQEEISIKDAQLEQFRSAEASKEETLNARVKFIRSKIEVEYRQAGEKQRVDLARKLQQSVHAMKREQTAWKEEFEAHMSTQLQKAMSNTLLDKEKTIKGLKSKIDALENEKKAMVETESKYEDEIQGLRSTLLKNKFDNEHFVEKQKLSNQSLLIEKDKAIEKLLAQLKDHNDLLQELHISLQKEQEEKEQLQRRIKLLQRQLDNTVETKHPGWV